MNLLVVILVCHFMNQNNPFMLHKSLVLSLPNIIHLTYRLLRHWSTFSSLSPSSTFHDLSTASTLRLFLIHSTNQSRACSIFSQDTSRRDLRILLTLLGQKWERYRNSTYSRSAS